VLQARPNLSRRTQSLSANYFKQFEYLDNTGEGSDPSSPKRRRSSASFEASYSGYERCWMLQPPQIPKCRQNGISRDCTAALALLYFGSISTISPPARGRFSPAACQMDLPGTSPFTTTSTQPELWVCDASDSPAVIFTL
jgi:hypothetical protein